MMVEVQTKGGVVVGRNGVFELSRIIFEKLEDHPLARIQFVSRASGKILNAGADFLSAEELDWLCVQWLAARAEAQ